MVSARRARRGRCRSRAGLIAGRYAHRRDPRRGSLVRDRASRGHHQHAAAPLQRRTERCERLRRVPGVRGGHHQRMRVAVLGQDRRAVHLHGKAETLDEHGTHDIAGHRRSAHTAERHGRDVLRGWETFGEARRGHRPRGNRSAREHGVSMLCDPQDAAPADRRDRSPLASALLCGASRLVDQHRRDVVAHRIPVPHVRHTMICWSSR